MRPRTDRGVPPTATPKMRGASCVRSRRSRSNSPSRRRICKTCCTPRSRLAPRRRRLSPLAARASACAAARQPPSGDASFTRALRQQQLLNERRVALPRAAARPPGPGVGTSPFHSKLVRLTSLFTTTSLGRCHNFRKIQTVLHISERKLKNFDRSLKISEGLPAASGRG